MQFFKLSGALVLMVATSCLLEDSKLVEEQDDTKSGQQGVSTASKQSAPSMTSPAAAGGAANRPASAANMRTGTAGGGTSAAPAPGGAPGNAGVAGVGAATSGSGGKPAAGSSMGMSGGSAAKAAAGSGMRPAGGAGGTGAVSGSAAMGGGAATWTEVFAALFAMSAAPGCGSCHGGAANPSLNGGLGELMGPYGAYARLVGAPSSSAMCSGKTYVKAGDPAGSLLYQKVAGPPMCGMRMPPGGTLNSATVELLESWIKAGAKND